MPLLKTDSFYVRNRSQHLRAPSCSPRTRVPCAAGRRQSRSVCRGERMAPSSSYCSGWQTCQMSAQWNKEHRQLVSELNNIADSWILILRWINWKPVEKNLIQAHDLQPLQFQETVFWASNSGIHMHFWSEHLPTFVLRVLQHVFLPKLNRDSMDFWSLGAHWVCVCVWCMTQYLAHRAAVWKSEFS